MSEGFEQAMHRLRTDPGVQREELAEIKAGLLSLAAEAPPSFDPEHSRRVMEAQRLVPVAEDGLTHFPGAGQPKRGSARGTRLSEDWRLVNCDDCRQLAAPPPLFRQPMI